MWQIRRMARLVALVSLGILATGCEPKQCETSADCPDGEVCVDGGGVFFSEASCMAETADAGWNVGEDTGTTNGNGGTNGSGDAGEDTDTGGCAGGEIICKGVCVDTSFDSEHCGSCDNACGDVEMCYDGECVTDCPDELTVCGDQCVDVDSDDDNCGDCDNDCGAEEVCDGGECVCGAGLTECDGECVDPSTDVDHCGECFGSCEIGCNDGSCVGAVDVAASLNNTCAVVEGGSLWCWGGAALDLLGGDFEDDYADTPIQMEGIDDAVAVSGVSESFCVLLESGEVMCWGSNLHGQIGHGTDEYPSDPVFVEDLDNAAAIDVGANVVCALLDDGAAKCWGMNGMGQLGTGESSFEEYSPVDVAWYSSLESIATFSSHTCVIVDDGGVECWGQGVFGTLGNGEDENTMEPVVAEGISTAVDVEVGNNFSCALLDSGEVRCWGRNEEEGRIGDGTTDNERLTPVSVDAGGFETLSTGWYSSCGVVDGAEIKCWGDNEEGQLGDGTTTHRPSPVTVEGISSAVTVDVGGNHACAVLEDGTVECWGRNTSGQLGDGTTDDSLTPVSVEW